MMEETRSLVLVHGAGSGPEVFRDWEEDFSGIALRAVDLQGGLDVSGASMNDYRDRVVATAAEMPQPVALCGWSMGGLVALMAAEEGQCSALILIEASPPGEVQGFVSSAALQEGVFDPEAVYGAFPTDVGARVESLLARGERKRGISVPSVSCPTLVISGDEFVVERGTPVAALYDAEHAHVRGLDHWGLVRSPEVRRLISTFLKDGGKYGP